MIKPHSSFLDMHGMRKRLEPKEVKTLKNPEGNISNICSATALQEYLRHLQLKRRMSFPLYKRGPRPISLQTKTISALF